MNRRTFVKGLSLTAFAAACGGCKLIEHEWDTLTGELSQTNEMFVKPFISTTYLSWNIHAGIGLDDKYDLTRIAAEIKRIGPDVALLQEVDRNTRRARGGDQVTALAEATGLKAQFCRTSVRGGGETGLVVLSRLEPAKVRTITLPGDGRLLLAEFPEYCAGALHLAEYAEDRMDSLPVLRETIEADRPLFLGGNWRDDFNEPFVREMRNTFAILSSVASVYEKEQADDGDDYLAISRRHRQRFEHMTRIPCEALAASTHRPLAVKVR